VIIVNAGEDIANDPKFCQWLVDELDIDPKLTWRVVLYPSTRMATVHQYDVNDKGEKYVTKRGSGEIAHKEPFNVKYDNPPPTELIPSLLGA